jgi:predicted permease
LTTGRDEERLRAEIEEHVALLTTENLRAGLAPSEARRQALLKFGGVETAKESYREQRGLPLMETLIRDTRYALRRLRMAPAFTVTTVLTLALGIGATTSIFTLVHAVLLKSLPVADPGGLYRLGRETRCCYMSGYSQDGGFSMVSYELYQYLRDNTQSFSDLAAFPASQTAFGVRRSGNVEAAQTDPGEFVSGNYFRTFGIRAYAGRLLTPEDDRPGAPPVAVMSYRLWHESYGSDPLVIGSVFNLDDKPFTVVGITPPGFFGDSLRATPPDIFLPLNAEPFIQVDADLKKYDTHWLDLIGRVLPGARPALIEAEMRVKLQQWLRAHWGEMSANDRTKLAQQTLYLAPGGAGITAMRERYEHWLKILLTVTGVVLLIVCANVAHLMLVRSLERRRQTSLSMALGAGASRLVRGPLIESVVLSLFGGLAGLGIAFAGTHLILHLAFPSLPGFASVPIDALPSMPVLLFALAISVATGLAFGMAPAWMATRVDPIEALRGASRSTSSTGSLPRKVLVVFQVALSLVLLSTAGLLTTAFERLATQDFGFAQDGLMVARFNARLAGYRTNHLSLLYRRIHDAIANLPGVASVTLCLYSPQSGGNWGSAVLVDGRPAPGPGDDYFASWDRVTAGFLEALDTPILKGRGISERDTASSRKVAVINEAFARKFFRGEDPIGKHFGPKPEANREFEIVGIAKDARFVADRPDRPIGPFFFLPEAQADYSQHNVGSLFLSDIVIRTKGGAGVSGAQVRRVVASVDPNLPIMYIRPLREQVGAQFTQQELIAHLTSFFGVLSLVLASIGLYGVAAYNAGRRVGEIGVRMALGADRRDVVRLILRGASALLLFGLLAGLLLTLAATRLLGAQLYGISPYNPVVMLGAALALGLSALIASLVPALRATSVSPLDALRSD